MNNPHRQSSGVKKRSPNACTRCRQQKIKCNGSFPCQQCSKRRLACSFDDSTRKVLVTKAFIHDLQQKAQPNEVQYGNQNLMATPAAPLPEQPRATLQEEVTTWLGDVDVAARQSPEPIAVEEDEDEGEDDDDDAEAENEESSSPTSQLMNPLAIDAGNYMANVYGKPIHLGTSSNWSFGRRVLRMSCERLNTQLPTDWLHFEGSVYRLDWTDLKVSTKPLNYPLPSADHAVYLINSVKFHCGQIFHLFDEESFMQQFSAFHEAHAFGKAFMSRNNNSSRPPGTELFLEAMRHLPEITLFPSDPIQVIEILVCASLYLQCLDFRNSAYNLIGQALRKALEQGMHTKMSTQDLLQSQVERCRRVWWTVYILDRQMSSLMGLPMGIRDDDISARLPNTLNGSQKNIGLELHVRLARVIADIMNTVYSTEGRIARRYLASTKQALKSIANVTNAIKDNFELPDNNSVAGISRLSAHLHLLHHQCICLTTRPLAYSFLERRLKSYETPLRYNFPRGSVRALLKTCIESAQQMLRILANLQTEGLLESFLPFDLEAVFTSTIILIMSNTIDHSLLDGITLWSETSFSLLDEMSSRGNMIAAFRRQELQQLATVLSRVPTAAADVTDTTGSMLATNDLENTGQERNHQTSSGRNTMHVNNFNDTGWHDELSAEQLMLLADTLDLDGLDWVASSLEDSSMLSQGFAVDT